VLKGDCEVRSGNRKLRCATGTALAFLLMPGLLGGPASAVAVGAEQPMRTIVFFGGVKTHGPGSHEHVQGAQLLKQCIDTADNIPPVKTRIYLDVWPEDSRELEQAATIVVMWEGWQQHFVNGRNMERVRALDKLMKRGVGWVCLHAATAVEDAVEPFYLDWVGGNKKVGYSLHPMVRNLGLDLASPGHAICRGVKSMKLPEEEFYCKIFFRDGDRRITPLLTAMLPPQRPEKQVVGWACQRADGGRAFALTGPHYHASFQNDDFRRLTLNGILWTAKIDVPKGGVHSTRASLGPPVQGH
jgi:type 1 glutamine amidotransferase